MAKVSPLMFIPPALFAGLAALFMFGMQRDNPNELPTALAGQQAPPVVVEPLGSAPTFSDETLRDGELKLVNFWASWCAPCRIEHPNLMELEAEGVKIYGINYKDKPVNANRFLAELGDPYAGIGTDEGGRMGINWGVYGVPETYLIDGEGKIVMRIAGPITDRELEGRLRPEMDKLK